MTAEQTVERALVQAVRARGGEAYKFVSPNRRGVPDRVCLLPGGRVVFVECKRPGGQLTRLQRAELERLRALGCETAVVDSVEAARRLGEEPKRRNDR